MSLRRDKRDSDAKAADLEQSVMTALVLIVGGVGGLAGLIWVGAELVMNWTRIMEIVGELAYVAAIFFADIR